MIGWYLDDTGVIIVYPYKIFHSCLSNVGLNKNKSKYITTEKKEVLTTLTDLTFNRFSFSLHMGSYPLIKTPISGQFSW